MVGEVRDAHGEIGLRCPRLAASVDEHGAVVVVFEAVDEDEARPEAGEEGTQVDTNHHDDLKRHSSIALSVFN